MTLTLNVVTHLGLNLYSNTPAALAEAVANSWDADANNVTIDVRSRGRQVTIIDDGVGMDLGDVNGRFLLVGYTRRGEKSGQPVITPSGRHVMGRKGIGKLSLFSVARTIDVYTVKDAERHAFSLSLDDIQAETEDPEKSFEYRPKKLSNWPHGLTKGTELVLRNLRKRLTHVDALRARLARRFSIIGPEHAFAVSVNGTPISTDDRDYFRHIQYVWYFGQDSESYRDLCNARKEAFERPAKINWIGGSSWVRGWIGTVRTSTLLKGKDKSSSLNKISVLAHGKVVDEDVLERFGEGGIYTKYVVGELQADFLDDDKAVDITTSARQRLVEDDPRYVALVDFVKRELLEIQNKWKVLRNKEGVEQALLVPSIREWFRELKGDVKASAERLFGRINELPIEDPRSKATLFRQGILAFERLRYQNRLQALDAIDAEDLAEATRLFTELDDLEAAAYYDIVSERLKVIEKLQQAVAAGVKERLVQKQLYEHLWLLNPAWERGTETPIMEKTVATAFRRPTRDLSTEKRRMRFDIKYKATPGHHVIIELKKADARITTAQIMDQLGKYETALRKILRYSEPGASIELICVLGKTPTDWTDPEQEQRNRRALDAKSIRVVFYQNLVDEAQKSYARYLDEKKEVGRVQGLLLRLESELEEAQSTSAQEPKAKTSPSDA